ncbi:hypothetical protein, partial [Streptomyces sp. NPDC102437]|uniref:hypothetical protein n=1 Tax=Streptomyces sp. NPDC102437 TaxID=3366175 RepID=UPI0037FA9A21
MRPTAWAQCGAGSVGRPAFPLGGHSRFSGTVAAPGVEGSLYDLIVAREAPMLPGVEDFLTDGSLRNAVQRDGDGALVLDGSLALLARDTSRTVKELTPSSWRRCHVVGGIGVWRCVRAWSRRLSAVGQAVAGR